MKLILHLLCALLIGVSTPSLAASASCAGDCVPIGKWSVSLALGYGSRTNPVVGQDDITYILVPRVSYYGKRFFLNTYDLGYTLIDSEKHQLNAILITPEFEQIFFNADNIRQFDTKNASALPPATPDNSQYFNLHKRHTAGFSGFEYTVIAPYFDWQTQLLQDVTNTHNGQKIRTALTAPWQYHSHSFSFSAGFTWQSQKLVNYYYGINAHETNLSTLQYTAKSSTAFHISAEWEKYLSQHWSLQGVANYRRLGKSVKDSPLINDDAVSTFYFAGVYHF